MSALDDDIAKPWGLIRKKPFLGASFGGMCLDLFDGEDNRVAEFYDEDLRELMILLWRNAAYMLACVAKVESQDG